MGTDLGVESRQALANMHNIEPPPDDIPIDDDGDPLWEPVPQSLSDDKAFSAAVRETIEHR